MASSDSEVDKLKEELATLRKDFAQLADTFKGASREQVREGAASARASANEVRDRAADGARRVESEIQDRPLTSVVAAFGVGFLLGKLLDR